MLIKKLPSNIPNVSVNGSFLGVVLWSTLKRMWEICKNKNKKKLKANITLFDIEIWCKIENSVLEKKAIYPLFYMMNSQKFQKYPKQRLLKKRTYFQFAPILSYLKVYDWESNWHLPLLTIKNRVKNNLRFPFQWKSKDKKG